MTQQSLALLVGCLTHNDIFRDAVDNQRFREINVTIRQVLEIERRANAPAREEKE